MNCWSLILHQIIPPHSTLVWNQQQQLLLTFIINIILFTLQTVKTVRSCSTNAIFKLQRWMAERYRYRTCAKKYGFKILFGLWDSVQPHNTLLLLSSIVQWLWSNYRSCLNANKILQIIIIHSYYYYYFVLFIYSISK